MKKEILIILVLLTSLISMHAANLTSPPISIVPRPAQVVPGEGNFTFSSQTLFSVGNRLQGVETLPGWWHRDSCQQHAGTYYR